MKKIFIILFLLLTSMPVFAGDTAGIFAASDKANNISDWGMVFGYQGKIIGGDFFLSNALSGIDAKIAVVNYHNFIINVGGFNSWTHMTETVNVAGVDIQSERSPETFGALIEIKYRWFTARYMKSNADYLFSESRVVGYDSKNHHDIIATNSISKKVNFNFAWVGVTAPF